MALSNIRALKYATPSEAWSCGKSGSIAAALSKNAAARANRSAAGAGRGPWAWSTPRLKYARASAAQDPALQRLPLQERQRRRAGRPRRAIRRSRRRRRRRPAAALRRGAALLPGPRPASGGRGRAGSGSCPISDVAARVLLRQLQRAPRRGRRFRGPAEGEQAPPEVEEVERRAPARAPRSRARGAPPRGARRRGAPGRADRWPAGRPGPASAPRGTPSMAFSSRPGPVRASASTTMPR